MQCLNCGFENMPGRAACGRCQSTLALAEVVVVPGRASRMRAVTRLARFWHRIEDAARTLNPIPERWFPAIRFQIDWRAIAWTIVPGLGHLRTRHRRLGRWMLGIWCGALFAALLSFPSDLTPWCVALAISVHATAFISLFAENLTVERMLLRALFGLLLFIGLQLGIYGPIQRAGGRLVQPLTVPQIRMTRPLASGDGLLYEGEALRRPPFARGDLVVYNIPAQAGRGYYSRAGHGIDRVVGVPGDSVEVRNGELLVNGRSPPERMRPLGPIVFPDFTMKLASDEYAIFPSLADLTVRGNVALERVAWHFVIAKEYDIRGRVLLRLRPWSRLGPIE